MQNHRCCFLCLFIVATCLLSDNTKAESIEKAWPLFRGNSHATGVASAQLPTSLSLLWKFEVKDGAFEGTAAIAGDVAFIGDLDGTVYALDLKSGAKKWEYKTEAGFIASPAIRDGFVFIGDYDGRFYCLDAAEGKLQWGFDTGAEIDSCANFYQGNVLVGSQDATLYCLDAKSGKLVWKHTIDDQIRCSPTIVEDRVFLAGCDGKLHILDLKEGKDIAQVEIGGPTGVTPAVVGDFVYFGTEGGEFLCINWKEASVAWTFAGKTSTSYRSSAAASNEQVIVGSRAKRVHSLNPKTGEELWTFAAKQRIDSSPVIVG
ncbi:MAG TPA: PQQ-binding-like beta-propeller repeat protein, partial [Pirellulaceae bacterium]|nr:PQQ-binding-like beta-propeller repeat protein [Pirellulaceae bacterium]